MSAYAGIHANAVDNHLGVKALGPGIDQIREHVEYKDTMKKIFHTKSLKPAMKYYHQGHNKIDELPTIIQKFIKKTL